MADFKRLEYDIKQMLNGVHSLESLELNHDTARRIVNLSKNIASHTLDMVNHKSRKAKVTSDTSIRMSELGEPCLRKLVYKWYHPDTGLPPYAPEGAPYLPVKFTFGDYIEELTLFLAAEAGHPVTCTQNEYRIDPTYSQWYAVGHIDAMIDDVVVDVKSAADASFKKYKREGLTDDNDSFGYRWQLDAYAKAIGTDKRAFIFTNKHDGELHIEDRSGEPLLPIEKRIIEVGSAASEYTEYGTAPSRLDTKPTKYGEQLGTVCSYCDFKWKCYDGNIVGVIKSGRPMYLKEDSLTPEGKELVTLYGKTPTPPHYEVPF